jgi:hypothetical protein
MNDIGSISSYMLSIQQLQLNIIKQNIEASQQIVEILTDASRTAPISEDKGSQVDINI